MVAQLLCAEVFVLDQNAYVIAGSNPDFINYSFNYIQKKLRIITCEFLYYLIHNSVKLLFANLTMVKKFLLFSAETNKTSNQSNYSD